MANVDTLDQEMKGIYIYLQYILIADGFTRASLDLTQNLCSRNKASMAASSRDRARANPETSPSLSGQSWATAIKYWNF